MGEKEKRARSVVILHISNIFHMLIEFTDWIWLFFFCLSEESAHYAGMEMSGRCWVTLSQSAVVDPGVNRWSGGPDLTRIAFGDVRFNFPLSIEMFCFFRPF